MANQIIQNYISDTNIPVEKRKYVLDQIQSGTSEIELASAISNKYGNIYETAQTNLNQSALERQEISPSFGDKFKKSFNELTAPARGALKGIGSTFAGASELGQRGLRAVTQPITGEQKPIERPEVLTQALTPKNTGEKIGFGMEQVGEFFIPGAVGLKVPSGAGIATKILMEGATASGVTAFQQGKLDKTVALTGAFASGMAGVAPAVGGGAKRIGNFLYRKVVPSTLLEKGRDISKALDLGEALSETGFSTSKKQLMSKIGNLVKSYGDDLQGVIDNASKNNPNKTWKIGELTKTVKEDILSNPEMLRKLKATPIDKKVISNTIDDVIKDYKTLYKGKKFDLQDLQDLKVALGQGLEKEFSKAVGASTRAKPMTEIVLRSKIQKTIEKIAPEVQSINQKLAPLLEASTRIKRKGAYSGYLTDVIFGGMYAGRPQDIIADPVGYFKDFLTGVIVKRGLTSTASKTASANLMVKLDKILESPKFAPAITGLINEVIGGQK